MKELEKGEYLAPEVEVVALALQGVIALSGDIEESSERSEIGW